jgi:hypothetical protein
LFFLIVLGYASLIFFVTTFAAGDSIGIVSTLPSTYPTIISARSAVFGRMETVTLIVSEGEPFIVGLGREVVLFGIDRRERSRRGDRAVGGWKGLIEA